MNLKIALAYMPLSFDGALQAVYDAEDKIPANAKEFYTQGDDEKWYLQAEITGVAGVKTFTDFSRLNEALRKERNDHGQLKAQVRAVGVPLADVRAQLDRVAELEAEIEASSDPKNQAKLDALVEKRATAKLAPVQRELETTKTQLAQATTEIEGFKSQGRSRSIADEVRKAASAAKMLPEAVDDALLISDRLFEVDESGAVVTKDGLKDVTAGISASDWVATMQQKRPHWWGTSGGGGANGSGRGGNMLANNPWTHDGWNMTQQAALIKSDPTRANALAKAAGHTAAAGALRPPKK